MNELQKRGFEQSRQQRRRGDSKERKPDAEASEPTLAASTSNSTVENAPISENSSKTTTTNTIETTNQQPEDTQLKNSSKSDASHLPQSEPVVKTPESGDSGDSATPTAAIKTATDLTHLQQEPSTKEGEICLDTGTGDSNSVMREGSSGAESVELTTNNAAANQLEASLGELMSTEAAATTTVQSSFGKLKCLSLHLYLFLVEASSTIVFVLCEMV